MPKKYWFAAVAATIALALSTPPLSAALATQHVPTGDGEISDARRLTDPELGYYGIAPAVATHPISGETIVIKGDDLQRDLTLFTIDADGEPGEPVVLTRSFLTSLSVTYFNSMFTVTPGPSGQWLLTYLANDFFTYELTALGFSVADGVITVDAAPIIVDGAPDNTLASTSYGASEGRYLIAYAKQVGTLGLATLERNAADTGFDIASDTETDFGFVSPNRVSDRSLVGATDTADGWIVTFGTGSPVSGAWWVTVSESGTTLTLGSPTTVSSSASGRPLHAQVISTDIGEIVIFRFDSGASGAVDRYQVRGRWITGAQSTADDIVFASYADPISRVRGSASGNTLALVWNANHNYADGPERAVLLTVPLTGDHAEPVMVATSESVQLRPDVTWSPAMQGFVIVWLERDPQDTSQWAVWFAVASDPDPSDDGPGPEPEQEPSPSPEPSAELETGTEAELAATGGVDTAWWAAAALSVLLTGLVLVVRRRAMS
jgi:LPXTG-motif cell wall-anchored protein